MSASEPSAPDRAPSFDTTSFHWARRRGLRGRIVYESRLDGLHCRGKNGGHLLLETSKIDGIRSIVILSRSGSFYTTRIWADGARQPAEITVHSSVSKEYCETIADLAQRVAELRGVERLERGSTRLSALGLLVIVLPLAFGSVIATLVAVPDASWFLRLGALFLLACAGLMLIWVLRVMWPRPVKSFDEYLAVLQGLKEQWS